MILGQVDTRRVVALLLGPPNGGINPVSRDIAGINAFVGLTNYTFQSSPGMIRRMNSSNRGTVNAVSP